MSDISDYLKRKIVDVRLARLLGEAIWALGSCISAAGLLLRTLILVVIGFRFFSLGYISVFILNCKDSTTFRQSKESCTQKARTCDEIVENRDNPTATEYSPHEIEKPRSGKKERESILNNLRRIQNTSFQVRVLVK